MDFIWNSVIFWLSSCVIWSHELQKTTALSTNKVPDYFSDYEEHDVMAAVKSQVPDNCLSIFIERNGEMFYQPVEEPRVTVNLVTLSDLEWKKMAESPLFGHGCMSVLMMDIPSTEDYQRLYLLRKGGIIVYYIIASKNRTQSVDFLTNPEFGKEENVVVVNKRSPTTWAVLMRQIHSPNGYLKTIKSDLWRPSSGFVQNQDLFPEQMNNFYGYRIRGCTLIYLPFTNYKVIPSRQAVQPLPSLDLLMLDLMAKKLNFTYDIIPPADGVWGLQTQDGKWKGIVGELYNGVTDLGITLSMTPKRRNYIDFSIGYYFDPVTFVTSKNRQQSSNWHKIVTPFQGEVWALLCITFAICCLFYLPLLRAKDNAKGGSFTSKNSIMGLYGSLLNQHVFLPFRLSARIFMAMWLIFSILITAYYKTSMMASITVPAVPSTIDSLQQLLNSNLEFGTSNATGYEYTFLKTSSNEVHQQIVKKLKFFTTLDSLKFVDEGHYSYIYFKSNMIYYIDRYFTDPSGFTNMHYAREELFTSTYTWGYPKGVPYRRAFNELMTKCIENGFMIHWAKEMKRLAKENDEMDSATDEDDSNQVVFKLDHMQGAFATLCIGYALSCTTFLAEVFISKVLVVTFSQSSHDK